MKTKKIWWKENLWLPLLTGIMLLCIPLLFEETRNVIKEFFSTESKDSTSTEKSKYRFISYIRYIDMRERRPVNKDSVLVKPISPVYLSRFIVLEKLSKDLDTIKLPMGTTGYSFEVRCPTHHFILERDSASDSEHYGRKFRHWTANVDVRPEEVGKPFTIIIQSIVWNGFPNDTLEWYAMHAEHGEATTLCIVFPKGKLPKNMRPTYYEGKEQPKDLNTDNILTHSKDSLVWFWQVSNPDTNYTYELQWPW